MWPWRAAPAPPTIAVMDKDSEARLFFREWEYRCRVNIDTHAWAERRFDRLNQLCAMLSIGSLIALGVVAGGFDLTHGRARYAALTLAVVSALASVLLTVGDYGSKAAAHKTAARQYGSLCRDIESLVLVPEDRPEEIVAGRIAIQTRWDWIADLAPNAPKSLRKKAKAVVRRARVV